MLRRGRERMPAYRQKAVESARMRGKTYEERLAELEGLSLEDHARSWLVEFDKAGVETGGFFAAAAGENEPARVVAPNPRRGVGRGGPGGPPHASPAPTRTP